MGRAWLHKDNKSPYWQIKWYDEHGKQRMKSTGIKWQADNGKVTGRREAEALLDAFNVDLKSERVDLADKTTFTQFADAWLRDYVEIKKKRSTVVSYTQIINDYLKPAFGKKKLTDIKPTMIDKYLGDKRREGRLSTRTINYHLSILKKMLHDAVKSRLLKHSPAEYIDKLEETQQEQERKRNKDVLTPAEFRALLNAAQGQFSPFLMVAITTSCRLSEIRALRWSDINFSEGIIRIQRNLYRKEVQTPKAGRERDVPMTEALKNALLKYEKTAPISEEGWIFCTATGKPLDSSNIAQRWFAKAVKDADITKKVSFHTIRHSYLTISASHNTSFETQALAGHSSVQTTDRYYVHLKHQAMRDAANRVSQAIFAEE